MVSGNNIPLIDSKIGLNRSAFQRDTIYMGKKKTGVKNCGSSV